MSLVSDTARDKLPEMVVSEIPTTLYEPVIHAMVLINKPSTATRSLFDFLMSDSAKAVFIEHGFLSAL